MGNVSEKVEAAAPAIAQPAQKTDEPKKLKPCCACPETKQARDACIMERGQENCEDFILAHKECMRKLGFQI